MKQFNTRREAWKANAHYTITMENLPWINWNDEDKALDMGNHILFQHFTDKTLSRPILGIFVGWGSADMALIMNYVEKPRAWMAKCEILTSKEYEYYTQYDCMDPEVQDVILWNDNIKLLGIWPVKPTLKQLLWAVTPDKDKHKRF